MAQVVLKEQHQQNGVSATLTNQTGLDMHLIRSHTWAGTFANLPGTITNNGGVSKFTHFKVGQGPIASEAGVSYTITTSAGNAAAVILAWSAPAIFNTNTCTPGNKVYGACGPRDLIDSMSWDQIKVALEKSAASADVKNDGVYVKATITNNPVTEMADILANFGVFP